MLRHRAIDVRVESGQAEIVVEGQPLPVDPALDGQGHGHGEQGQQEPAVAAHPRESTPPSDKSRVGSDMRAAQERSKNPSSTFLENPSTVQKSLLTGRPNSSAGSNSLPAPGWSDAVQCPGGDDPRGGLGARLDDGGKQAPGFEPSGVQG